MGEMEQMSVIVCVPGCVQVSVAVCTAYVHFCQAVQHVYILVCAACVHMSVSLCSVCTCLSVTVCVWENTCIRGNLNFRM